MKRHKIQLPLIFTLVLAASAVSLAGCASAPTIRADVTPGGAALVMKASNFAFDPNMVSVHGTGVVTVTITNTSGTGHNITVDDPKGKGNHQRGNTAECNGERPDQHSQPLGTTTSSATIRSTPVSA